MPVQIYRKFYLQKLNIFRQKTDIFHISAQNIDCGYSFELPRQGCSNNYPQSMFLTNKKNNVYPCKPQFYYIKMVFKGVTAIYRHVFVIGTPQLAILVLKFECPLYHLFSAPKNCGMNGKQCRCRSDAM